MIILISNAGFEPKTYRFAVNPLFLKSFLFSESSSFIKKFLLVKWTSNQRRYATLLYGETGKEIIYKIAPDFIVYIDK